jgi:DGQHR domain-containing protein
MPKYDGLLIFQRASAESLPLFVFAAPAGELLSWSKILQTAKVRGAAQRLENLAHIQSIRSYVRASPSNIIPTSVTLALEEGRFKLVGAPKNRPKSPKVVSVTLEIPGSTWKDDADKPASVIDGQHRLRALADADESIPVVVTAILGASELERALHFVVINNKAKRVSGDLVRGIVAELPAADQEHLKKRLVAVGLTLGNYPTALDVLGCNEDSPFRDLIDWDINRDGTKRIKPQALETALRSVIADLRTPDRLDIDDAVEVLSAMWRGVSAAWDSTQHAWSDKESKLPDKAGLVAVTEFLVERLNLQIEEGFNISDLGEVEGFSKKVMSNIPATFWLVKWNKGELDTSSGRSLIKQSLADVRRATASGLEDPLSFAALVGARKPDEKSEE